MNLPNSETDTRQRNPSAEKLLLLAAQHDGYLVRIGATAGARPAPYSGTSTPPISRRRPAGR